MVLCFSAKKCEMMQMGRSSDELKDTCVFICCKTDSQVADVAERGIEVKASNASNLGKCIPLLFQSTLNCICRHQETPT